MGNKCTSCTEESDLAAVPNKLKIYGDYLSQDTRALLAICEYCEEEVDLIYVDTLKRENNEKEYVKMNANMTVPIIVKNN